MRKLHHQSIYSQLNTSTQKHACNTVTTEESSAGSGEDSGMEERKVNRRRRNRKDSRKKVDKGKPRKRTSSGMGADSKVGGMGFHKVVYLCLRSSVSPHLKENA